MEKGKSKVLIQFFLIFRLSGDVLFFLYARKLRRFTATEANETLLLSQISGLLLCFDLESPEVACSFLPFWQLLEDIIAESLTDGHSNC